MIQEVRVRTIVGSDVRGEEILAEVKSTLGIQTVDAIKTVEIFRLEGLSEKQAREFALKALVEGLTQIYSLNVALIDDADFVLEVGYRPGVMNPVVASIQKAAVDLGFSELVAADTSREYHFYGRLTSKQIALIERRLLVNPTVQWVITEPPTTLLLSGTAPSVQIVPIRALSDEELVDLSSDKLFLNLAEMHVIQNYFREIECDPTDVELETIAQTWSEHCSHKTFKANLTVDGFKKDPLMSRLRSSSERHFSNVVSAFVDNSGVVRFNDEWSICGKVETHNSPSAIEPYGGAATGSGGVFRDVMGTGQGAAVIASTDIFCFAPPDYPVGKLPPGCLDPHYLLRRVVAGVRDYGNRMGIPTNNGSIHFHRDFRAKPTVIVGSYGLIPTKRAQKGKAQVGDKIVVLGGRTGRDGIHGATFSSGEMTERTATVNSSAVQIGNAIEEKRTLDAIVELRDKGLIRALTDCGAGGFSSAIGEMGEAIGVCVELEKAPLKYAGLAPWEIWVSESQERMVLCIAEKDISEMERICSIYNVEATVLGEFTGTNRLQVFYGDDVVCNLSMNFLHHGLPQREMTATLRSGTKKKQSVPRPKTPEEWCEVYTQVMTHWNVCSKRPVVQQYDHGVQGSNVLPPYGGVTYNAPNDAVVLQPFADQPEGVVISHGLNPTLSLIDPYLGTLWAATEAMSNYVAVGGDPDGSLGLIDNFIWPFPDQESLGDLDQAIEALCDVSRSWEQPFVSGKDSLSSTYRGKDGAIIKIPPVVCVSVFGKIDDVKKTVTADFKKIGSKIMLLGYLDGGALGGSIYFDLFGRLGNRLPSIRLAVIRKRFRLLHKLIKEGKILSAHDISEGGLAVALAEMCFGGACGAKVDLFRLANSTDRPDYLFFNETPGCFLVEIDAESDPMELFGASWEYDILGEIIKEPRISVNRRGQELFSIDTSRLLKSWEKPMQEVFHS